MRAGFFGARVPQTKATQQQKQQQQQQQKPDDAERGGGGGTSTRNTTTTTTSASTSSSLNAVVTRHWPHGHRFVPSPDGCDDNLLVMLHGRGDTPTPFAALAARMRLPCTAALILAGPLEVPFTDGGREWFVSTDPITYHLIDPESTPGERRRVDSLDVAVRQLMRLLEALAPTSPPSPEESDARVGGQEGKQNDARRWPRARLHLFGFSDGGTVALEAAAGCVGERRLGGAAVVCASLLPEVLAGPAHEAVDASAAPPAERSFSGGVAAAALARFPPDPRAPTPVTLTCGSADRVVPRGRVDATAAALRARNPGCAADVHVIEGKSHGMVASEDVPAPEVEMRKLMAFWGMTLARRPAEAMGEGVYEVTPRTEGHSRVSAERVVAEEAVEEESMKEEEEKEEEHRGYTVGKRSEEEVHRGYTVGKRSEEEDDVGGGPTGARARAVEVEDEYDLFELD